MCIRDRATSIPPHNLGEVIDGALALINKKDIKLNELMKHIPGPDFPTGGIIIGKDIIKQGYKTGRGSFKIRGEISVENLKNGKDRLVISSIPYQINKANLNERIAELVRDKKIEGISDIRDESDRNGLRIIYDLKRDAIPNVVLNNLYKYTQLQSSFGVNNVALVNGRPKTLNLKELIENYVTHRHEVVTRRTEYELKEAEKRSHILQGYIIALDNIDDVIELIKKSKSPEEAKNGLIKKYKLSEIQAKAILELRLSRLTALETDKLKEEYEELIKEIKRLQEILSTESVLVKVVKKELEEIKSDFGDERRTEIIEKRLTIDDADLIPEEERVFTISNNGFVKTQQLAEYRSQRRGGVGKTASALRDEDFIKQVLVLNTHVQVLCFTTKGKVHWLEIYKLPVMSRTAKGRPISNVLPLEEDERVTSFLPVDEYKDGHYILMATRNGVVKKTVLKAFEKKYAPGLRAINLDDGDKLIGTVITNGSDEICLASESGKAIRFNETDVRPMGRSTRGVKGMNIHKEDKVISIMKVIPEAKLLTISQNGYGKRTNISEFSGQKRGGKGVIALNTSQRNGKMIAAVQVIDGDEVMLIGNRGTLIRTQVDQISVIGRNTQGVKVVSTRDEVSLVDAVGFKETLDEE